MTQVITLKLQKRQAKLKFTAGNSFIVALMKNSTATPDHSALSSFHANIHFN
jgi:hypothetical protein